MQTPSIHAEQFKSQFLEHSAEFGTSAYPSLQIHYPIPSLDSLATKFLKFPSSSQLVHLALE